MATTVNGTLKDKSETALQKTVLTLKCTDGMTVVGSSVTIHNPNKTCITDGSGDFTIDLAPGNYDVWIGGLKYCTIAVPSSGPVEFHEITDLASLSEINILSSQLWMADDSNLVRVTVVSNGVGYEFQFNPL
jgi:hypothetical protein